MNLLRIQDALKNASDDQLMGLLRTPDATAPSYLVLSEIKRRKDMRAQQPEEPQGTVAEDLAKESTYDDQGIRSLKTPGYEEEAQRADPEGIQGMRRGGVVRMQDGGTPPRLEDFYTGRPLSEMSDAELRALGGPNVGAPIPRPGRLRFQGLPSSPLLSGMPEDQRQVLMSEARLELGRRQPASRNFSAMGPEPEMTEEEMLLQPSPVSQSTPPSAPAPASLDPSSRGYTGAESVGNAPFPAAGAGAGAGAAAGAAGAGAAAGRPGSAGGIGALGSGGSPDFDRLYAANMSRFPGLPADLQERMRAMRTKPEEQRSKALNMSLIEAGLRMMASKNPSLLGSIGESAVPAVQSYAQQQAQIRKDQREDIKDELSVAQANLARAYYAGQITAAQYRTAVSELGANARAALAANAQERLAERTAAGLESRERIAAGRDAANAQRAADLALYTALRNPELRNQTRLNLQMERTQAGNRTPVTESEVSDAIRNLGIRPGAAAAQGSIVVQDGVQTYVRPGS